MVEVVDVVIVAVVVLQGEGGQVLTIGLVVGGRSVCAELGSAAYLHTAALSWLP